MGLWDARHCEREGWHVCVPCFRRENSLALREVHLQLEVWKLGRGKGWH